MCVCVCVCVCLMDILEIGQWLKDSPCIHPCHRPEVFFFLWSMPFFTFRVYSPSASLGVQAFMASTSSGHEEKPLNYVFCRPPCQPSACCFGFNFPELCLDPVTPLNRLFQ